MGVNTTRDKVLAFVIASSFAGVAGGLFAHYNMYLHTNSFTFIKSIEFIIMVVLGGLGSIAGRGGGRRRSHRAARGAARLRRSTAWSSSR